MSSNPSQDAPTGQDGGTTFPGAHRGAEWKAVDTTVEGAATDDLLRLVPFDVVAWYREAWRRCGYMEH